MGPQPKKAGKAVKKGPKVGKKKRTVLTFHIECKHPVEDGIMNAADFVSPSFPFLPSLPAPSQGASVGLRAPFPSKA